MDHAMSGTEMWARRRRASSGSRRTQSICTTRFVTRCVCAVACEGVALCVRVSMSVSVSVYVCVCGCGVGG
eukprot:3899871-Rhodomonas_salina.2